MDMTKKKEAHSELLQLRSWCSNLHFQNKSPIQTIINVLDDRITLLAGCTAGRESHPALKSITIFIVPHHPGANGIT